jgi:hypothetical protein
VSGYLAETIQQISLGAEGLRFTIPGFTMMIMHLTQTRNSAILSSGRKVTNEPDRRCEELPH